MASRRGFLSHLSCWGMAGWWGGTAEAAARRKRPRGVTTTAPLASPTRAASSPSQKAEFIQPDYRQWEQIEINMPQEEVLQILGKPLYRQDQDPEILPYLPKPGSENGKHFNYYWTYGRLNFADPDVPAYAFEFTIDIRQSTQLVSRIIDPFPAGLSKNGAPTTPQLTLPGDHTRWHHYPRFVDLRWHPSAGEYPIHYEIEWGFRNYSSTDTGANFTTEPLETSAVPHHTLVGAMGHVRWRVRGVNRLGKSEWSEYRVFEFTV